ncbi:MAG: TetR/AcrR family transcriptional regulator [bacterium]
MARPSGDAEQRLMKAGKEILEQSGFQGLSVRAVAARAGVNLGLISYHFGNKEAFVRRVALEVYEEFFRDFSLQVEGERDPLMALRKGLLRLARFARDHRNLVRGLLRDLADGETEGSNFIQTNVPRHGIILAGLVLRCQAEGRLVDLPLPVVMITIMGIVMFPTIVAEPFLQARFQFPDLPPNETFKEWMLSDAALETRVDLAMKAIKADSGGRSIAVPGV